MKTLSPGKLRGFVRISNKQGIFQILALDQRNSLKRLIEKTYDVATIEDIISVKKAVLRSISNEASAVLLDGEYALPNMVKFVSRFTGVILSLEKSGYVSSNENQEDRINQLYREDAIELAKKWAVDAVKLLIYWSESSSKKTKDHQLQLVEEVGNKAAEQDILFILEILTYGQGKGTKDEILSALSTFSEDKYRVDLFKIEPFKEPVSRGEVFEATNGKPWVVLSGGMDIEDFIPILQSNVKAGASGFLAGRVVWKEAVRYTREPEKMSEYLSTQGLRNLNLLKESVKTAIPWYATPFFEGFENISISG